MPPTESNWDRTTGGDRTLRRAESEDADHLADGLECHFDATERAEELDAKIEIVESTVAE